MNCNILHEPNYYYDRVKYIKVEQVNHKGKERIKLLFDYDIKLIECVKKLTDCRWSATMKCWHIPYREDFLGYLKNKFSEVEIIFINNTKTNKRTRHVPILDFKKQQEINKFKYYLKSKRYSDSTIENYVNILKHFFNYFKEKEICDINNKDIVDFNYNIIIKGGYSRTTQNHLISASIENKGET